MEEETINISQKAFIYETSLLPKKRKREENEDVEKYSNIIRDCPYLGTVRRDLLDFDFEKVCSISLSNINVYACLVCGKYYQGRGKDTFAYTHSLEQEHHIFINLTDQNIYCLPDNYEIHDNSLNDIKFNLKPSFTKDEVVELDKLVTYSRALDGTDFLPGCIGLNNIKKTDYVNVIIQSLCRINTLRNFMLEYDDSDDIKFELKGLLTQRFAELIRKIWNSKNFKGHVSPHEVLQAISLASKGQFKIVQQSDSINFLSWFFNTLHEYLSKKYNKKSSKSLVKIGIISKSFQGKILVETFTHIKESELKKMNESEIDVLSDLEIVLIDNIHYRVERKIQTFFFLTLDLPKTPLFKDSTEKINIPQISIYTLFKKYDGVTFTEDPIKGIKRRYHLIKLPPNLILYFKRFEKNQFFVEKNNTIINFPIKNLELKEFCNENTVNKDLNYNLVSNIIHDGKPGAGLFRVQVKHKLLDSWFDIQDLHVNKIMAQLVAVSESYIHFYESD